MNDITAQDMMALQTDNFDLFAATAVPIFTKNIKVNELNADEKKYLDILKSWNLRDDAGLKAPTVFDILWKSFVDTVFDDEYAKAPKVIMHPFKTSIVEGILKDSAYKFLDNINTAQTETLADDVTAALKNASAQLKKIEADGKLDWEKYKSTGINHLAKLAPFSRLNLPAGGGENAINATKQNHGPSWRMVVSLTAKTEAYGIYPGGQSGNPGSKFYDNFIDDWVKGKYYSLWMMTKEEQASSKVKWKMSFSN
jgi:penicillin amidase